MEPIKQLNDVLQSFNIKANCINYKKSDNYFFYDLELEPHVRVNDIQKFKLNIFL